MVALMIQDSRVIVSWQLQLQLHIWQITITCNRMENLSITIV